MMGLFTRIIPSMLIKTVTGNALCVFGHALSFFGLNDNDDNGLSHLKCTVLLQWSLIVEIHVRVYKR